MGIELRGRKVWVSSRDGYGDKNWKEKMIEIIKTQNTIIIEGRYGDKNLDMDYSIKGYPFSSISKEIFLKKLQNVKIGYGDNVYLYDAFENTENIHNCRQRQEISEANRYIFVSHTATECQML